MAFIIEQNIAIMSVLNYTVEKKITELKQLNTNNIYIFYVKYLEWGRKQRSKLHSFPQNSAVLWEIPQSWPFRIHDKSSSGDHQLYRTHLCSPAS